MTCSHPKAKQQHICDNGSTSGGCVHWCSACGAISITSGDNARERKWRWPAAIVEAPKPKIRDAIRTWLTEMQNTYPLSFKSHSSYEPEIQQLTDRIARVVESV